MFDGIKIQNLSVSVDAMLTSNRLTFPLAVDEQTGAVIDGPRRATDRGLTFTIDQRAGQLRCELNGSLHRYHNDGQHNANDFTAADLLTVLDDLVRSLDINPFLSRLNNVEFGVNIVLPFPVKRVLDALICYKGKPFVPGPDGPVYYQCKTEQFILKVYDKGRQYNRKEHLLRFEVKVMRMQFLTSKGVKLNTLADLLNTDNYPKLGKLLSEYFNGILFDEPSIKPRDLPPAEADLLRDGRNPRYWQLPDDLPTNSKEYNRVKKQRQRDERRFRDLLQTHRRGHDWQGHVTELIRAKWHELTTVPPTLTTEINAHLNQWRSQFDTPKTCPEFTGVTPNETGPPCDGQPVKTCPDFTDLSTDGMSPNYTKYKGEKGDNQPPAPAPAFVCPITGLDLSKQPGPRKFVSASTLRKLYDTDRTKFDDLAARFLTSKQAGADLNKRCYHIAHNVRNRATNIRNNTRRRLLLRQANPLPLFSEETLQPPAHKRATLNHWQGTRFEVRLLSF